MTKHLQQSCSNKVGHRRRPRHWRQSVHAIASTALLALVMAAAATLPALAAESFSGDPAAGKHVYARCMGCHSPARNRTGPMHCGVFGRVSGTVPGYDYSQAMQEAAITWTAKTLNWFLKAPMKAIPGTKMTFAGVKDDQDRHDLIAYLATLDAESPACQGVPAAILSDTDS